MIIRHSTYLKGTQMNSNEILQMKKEKQVKVTMRRGFVYKQ